MDFDEDSNRCGSFKRKTMKVFGTSRVSPRQLACYEDCSSEG